LNLRESENSRWTDKAFLGHPRGLGFLCFSEAWERFSYYGMQALLVLYMTHSLLQPGHADPVLGFEPFRRAIEAVYGSLSPQALASVIFGLYAGLVYLTPIAGGILADRVIGRTRAITVGALLMVAGHFLMAFEVSFLVALLCLLIGVGCFKGNIATQVGELYAADDPRRGSAFQVYLLGIQFAVIVSPLICGTLGEVYGWHWGFAAAGVGMLVGLTIYRTGRAWLPPEAVKSPDGTVAARPILSATDRRTVLVLVLLIPVLAVGAVGNQQIFNAFLIWGEANLALTFFGKVMPVTWIISLDAAASAALILLSVLFWRWWATIRKEPDEITKLTIGVTISALAPLILVLASFKIEATGEKAGLGWAIAFELLNELGFANVFPIGLALFSRAAPKGFGGMLIGAYYTHLFLANMLVGWLGGLLERMSGTSFWFLHTGLIGATAVILIVVRGTAGKMLLRN